MKRGGGAFIPMELVVESDTIEHYVQHLAALVGTPDEHTFFVTQSIGGQLALRYLASLPAGSSVGGVFSIAGWFSLNPAVFGGSLPEALVQWCDTATLDVERVNAVCRKFTLLIGDDDPYCDVPEQVSLWQTKVQAATIVRPAMGHYLNPNKESTEGWRLPEEDLQAITQFLGV